jgi:hypothetical protein
MLSSAGHQKWLSLASSWASDRHAPRGRYRGEFLRWWLFSRHRTKSAKNSQRVFLDSTGGAFFGENCPTYRMARMPINNECNFGGIQVISALQSNEKWKINEKHSDFASRHVSNSRGHQGPRTIIGFSSWAASGWLVAAQAQIYFESIWMLFAFDSWRSTKISNLIDNWTSTAQSAALN